MYSSSLLFFWVLLSCFFIFPPPSLSLPFAPPNNVTLFGDAYFKNDAISLTNELGCLTSSSSFTSSCGVGRVIYAYPIRFLDPITNSTASFISRFSFSITPSTSSRVGDGLAFLITSNADASSSSLGCMGLLNSTIGTQDSFIAVEFDTSFDPSLGDMNDNHVGLDIDTIVSSASVDVGSMGIDLKSGKSITAWIEYSNVGNMIRVWVGYSRFRPLNPLLTARVDLSQQFREFMHIGFSASNGRGAALYLIDRWRFRTFGFLTSVTSNDTVQGDDCLVCFPDDSNLQNGYPGRHQRKLRDFLFYFIGAAAFLLSLVVAVGGTIWCLKRKRRIDRERKISQICSIQAKQLPARLSLADIQSATRGFHPSKIVGEGASGTVYEGCLSGRYVAVKRFIQTNQGDCFRDPFTTELVTMVGCLRHRNLVQLQGWCCERDELALVYEYLPYGSLDKVLHRDSNLTELLIWGIRRKIVLGVASALTYLHEECERQIIHRDVKACNIMLDAEFNAKLGDFGLAEVYDHSNFTREATIPAGTMGYLAPEYVHSGVPTVKTDVYSFGVVMLELATGKVPVDDDGTVLVNWAWDMWAKGKLMEAVDCRLKEKFDKVGMEAMLMVGLSCVHPNCTERPTVKQAARMLRGEAPLPVLPPKKPVVRLLSVLPEGSEEITNGSGNLDHGNTPWSTPLSHLSYY